jgi:hypothetical protein
MTTPTPPPAAAPVPAGPKVNGLALGALVCSLAAGCGIGSVLGIVLGVKAKKQIAEAPPGTYTGEGFAKAGIIIGVIGLVLLAVYLVVVIASVASS